MLVYDEAVYEIYNQFNEIWIDESAAIVGYIPEVRWPGIPEPAKPPQDKFWIRFTQRNVIEQQATLSNCVTEPFKRRYENSGFIVIQLFCPRSKDTSMHLGRNLAKLARSAYRGKTTAGGIVFRNVTIVELDPEELFYRFNVKSEYEFGEIG